MSERKPELIIDFGPGAESESGSIGDKEFFPKRPLTSPGAVPSGFVFPLADRRQILDPEVLVPPEFQVNPVMSGVDHDTPTNIGAFVEYSIRVRGE